MNHEELFAETAKSRDLLYASLGKVDDDVIAHLVNPAFTGGPAWPAIRQAFSVIRTSDSTIVASNGLSDPFYNSKERNSGFEIEIIAETHDKIYEDISKSWLFKLVYSVAQQAAYSGQIKSFLEHHGVITMELFAEDDGLEEFQNDNGMVGVMLGVEHPNRPRKVLFPGAEVMLVAVKILTPVELDYVVEHRAEGRKKIRDLFQKNGSFHFSEIRRKSVV